MTLHQEGSRMRTITDQLTTATDVLAWLRKQPLDEDTAAYRSVLETFVADTKRVLAGHEVEEYHYHRLWTAQAVCSILIEELLEDSATDLTGYLVGTVPTNMAQCLITVLDDCLFRFTQVLLSVRRKRGRDFHPQSIAGAHA
jgi:hypothetical protein